MHKILGLFFLCHLACAQSQLRAPASAHLLDDTTPKPAKDSNGTFKKCQTQVQSLPESQRLNFLDECMRAVVDDWELKSGNPLECLETARLGKQAENISLLSKICSKGLMYYLCKVEKSQQSPLGRLDCLSKYSSSINYKDCKPEYDFLISNKKELEKEKLTAKQRAVLSDRLFCDRPSFTLPPSMQPAAPAVKPAAPGQR